MKEVGVAVMIPVHLFVAVSFSAQAQMEVKLKRAYPLAQIVETEWEETVCTNTEDCISVPHYHGMMIGQVP